MSARRAPPMNDRGLDLLANAQRLTDRPVTVDVLALEVIEQAAALANQHQQPAPRVMVLRVHLEVLGEVGDALRKESDLHLRGPGVARDTGEFLNYFCLLNSGQTHVTLGFSLFFCASMSYEIPVES